VSISLNGRVTLIGLGGVGSWPIRIIDDYSAPLRKRVVCHRILQSFLCASLLLANTGATWFAACLHQRVANHTKVQYLGLDSIKTAGLSVSFIVVHVKTLFLVDAVIYDFKIDFWNLDTAGVEIWGRVQTFIKLYQFLFLVCLDSPVAMMCDEHSNDGKDILEQVGHILERIDPEIVRASELLDICFDTGIQWQSIGKQIL